MTIRLIDGLAIAACLATLACGAEATAPDLPSGPTTLQVEPDAALAPDDPSGVVNLAVWPHEAGGQISIEVCVARDGRPLAARDGLPCDALGGSWAIARDQSGQAWVARTWPGWATVRFAREAEQPPMLFRASYEAPDGGRTRDVPACTWLLAASSDVGVACRSNEEHRVMPVVAGGSEPAVE